MYVLSNIFLGLRRVPKILNIKGYLFLIITCVSKKCKLSISNTQQTLGKSACYFPKN